MIRKSMGVFCKMTGDFSVSSGGKRIDFFSKSSYKATQLLAMLLFYHDEGVSKSSLLEAIYGDEANTNPSNSLKTLMFRLRKQLEETSIASKEYIIYKNGLYYFDPDVDFSSDIMVFRNLLKQAEQTNVESKKYDLYRQAVNSINGSLLPMFSSEIWVLSEKRTLEQEYGEVIRKLVSYYTSSGEQYASKELYFRAKAMFPHEDQWEIGYLNCLVKEGRLEEATEEYERYKKLLFDDMAAYPDDALQQCYRMIVKKKNFNGLNADEVVSELLAAKPTSAYRCSFAKFADNFHLLRRIMVRDNIESSLVLCGIVDSSGKLVTDYDLIERQVGYLENALLYGLRKSDIITRYGVSQMLVLLWNTPNENVHFAIDRINESFNLQNRDGGYQIKYIVIDNDKLDFE